jgi:hypothetical protein
VFFFCCVTNHSKLSSVHLFSVEKMMMSEIMSDWWLEDLFFSLSGLPVDRSGNCPHTTSWHDKFRFSYKMKFHVRQVYLMQLASLRTQVLRDTGENFEASYVLTWKLHHITLLCQNWQRRSGQEADRIYFTSQWRMTNHIYHLSSKRTIPDTKTILMKEKYFRIF